MNTGTITTQAVAEESDANAYGVYSSRGVTGSFVNTGTITAKAISRQDDATAVGFYVSDSMDENIVNTGSISISATAADSAEGRGIKVSGTFDGDFVNTGSISVNTTVSSSPSAPTGPSGPPRPPSATSPEAIGVYVKDKVTGNLVTTGAIDVTAASNEDVAAAAVYLAGDLNGDFTNTGSISVSTSSSDGKGTSTGLLVKGAMTGRVGNSGNVNISALDTTSAEAVAFDLESGLTGSFVNTGTINVHARDTVEDEVEAFGLRVANGMTGNIVNTGVMNIRGEGYSSVTATAFEIRGGLTGDFTNTGTINAVAIDQTDEAYAYGLYVRDGMDGNIGNSGTVSVRGDGNSSATVAGFYISGGLTGNFVNTGSISAVATDETEEAEAYGLHVRSGMTGDITNTGSISARGDGYSEATVAGIYISGGLTGNVSNTGSITVHATDNTISAEAYGLYVSGGLTGNVTNSGSITVTSDGGTSADATSYGIYSSSGFDGTLSNSGSITATSVSNTEEATARGITLRSKVDGSIFNGNSISVSATGATEADAQAIYLSGVTTADITNSGTLTATAMLVNGTPGADADATGVSVRDMQGVFSNTGMITATASGGANADAYGLYFDNFDGVITDVGEISATSDGGDAYAIYLGTGTGTLNVDSTDKVSGLIRVQDHNVNLDAQGGSAVFRFEDAAPGVGSFATTVSDSTLAWYVQDENGAAPIYAVVDSAGIAPSGDVVAFYGSVIGGSTGALSYGQQDQVSRSSSFDPARGAIGAFRPFVEVEAADRRFKASSGADTDVSVANGSAGYSGQLENGLALALRAGVFHADGDNASDFDTDGFYLDAALGRQIGAYTFEAGLGYGWLSTNSTREITGSPNASGEYDSTLLTAYVGVDRVFEVNSTLDMVGFADVRYTRQENDGYTETGSIANATVGDNTVEVVEARLGVEAEMSVGHGGLVFGQLSGVVRRDLGDSETSVTVFSSTNNLTFASTDFTGASVSVGYEQEIKHDLLLEVTAEKEIGDAAQGPFFQAGLRWSF
ncbi:autotransporter domain-containing protein [Ruegeria sp. EL01]|uniref:autotransporter outer membrane beta-barrel domain-containing protein n=1 Tax=Ruegeria sp. EL01 TaxID=2107578 RepID=UPI000EA82DF7|nr:autotransporter domain-containing protein [Ruegeria sp. EL01]